MIEAAEETKALVDFGHAWLEAWSIDHETRRRLLRAEELMDAGASAALWRARTAALAEVGRDEEGLRREMAEARARRCGLDGRTSQDGVGD